MSSRLDLAYRQPLALMRWLLPMTLLWPGLPNLAVPLHTPHLDVELVSDVRTIAPGRPFTVALRLRHEPHWHTYWRNPGDSGMATAIRWVVPEGFEAGALQWPTPARLPIGPLTNFGYEGEVLLLTGFRPPEHLARGGRIAIAAQAEWLVCKDVCIPGIARLTLKLPVAGAVAEPDPRWAAVIDRARADLPRALSDWTAEASQSDGIVTLALLPPSGASTRIDRLIFFPDEDGIIENAAEQRLKRQENRYLLSVPASQGLGTRSSVTGLLVAEPGWWGAGAPAAAQVELSVVSAVAPDRAVALSLLAALALAFVGGLILNLMPCVFPIVSIKTLGFVEQAHGDRRRLRAHGLTFAAGVLVCFWALAATLIALRAAGAGLGWGYQLQSPLVVAALGVLFFLLALNLSGLFEIGSGLQRIAGAPGRDGYRGSFLAGLLATVVATPCTAPFMGAALGYALAQPPRTALLVFTALALGMALPYVSLSLAPGLVRQLPRPGRWMQTLKQLLAFPLYLTVVWLTWVLGEQAGLSAATHLLVGLVLIGAAAWVWGRFGAPATGARTRLLSGSAVLALAAAGAAIAWPGEAPGPRQMPAQSAWQPYSEEALARARSGGRWAFVDFTAAWCVTCQVNKRLVLDTDAVARRFAERRVVLIRADWTSRDARIGEALRRLGRSGIPVYALYPPKGGPPRILPGILTRDVVLGALDAAEPI